MLLILCFYGFCGVCVCVSVCVCACAHVLKCVLMQACVCVSHVFSLFFCFFVLFWIVCLFIGLFFKEREKEDGSWMGRERERIWEGVREGKL